MRGHQYKTQYSWSWAILKCFYFPFQIYTVRGNLAKNNTRSIRIINHSTYASNGESHFENKFFRFGAICSQFWFPRGNQQNIQSRIVIVVGLPELRSNWMILTISWTGCSNVYTLVLSEKILHHSIIGCRNGNRIWNNAGNIVSKWNIQKTN